VAKAADKERKAARPKRPGGAAAPRTIWKGAIAFGLVNIPVALHAASRAHTLDFDWLDKRDMAPVGYQRINKRTGKAVEAGDIVKGYEYERGQYVLLTDEDFRQANPEATQTVEILGFVDVAEITPEYFETPYWLEAGKRGEKGYALLRQVLRTSHRAGIASMVISRKQHLATLLVRDEWLMLVTLRWADEVLAPKDMSAVPDGKSAVAARDVEMAQRLVDEMTQKKWDPSQYKDSYRDDLMARIDSRIKSGRTHELTPPAEEGAPAEGAKVIDLMTALRESLDRKGGKTKEAKEKAAPARRKRA
jgi:DNA end-binding protein Ku